LAQQIDFLVIGGGLAGLTFALNAARHGSVLVLTKAPSSESASDKAQGGIASVVSEEDSFEFHENDTLEAGAGLCKPEVVRMCIQAGPESIEELTHLGVPFSRDKNSENNEFDLGKEGGHSKRRVLHAGDFTGHEIMQSLITAAMQEPNIKMVQDQLAVNLILEPAEKSGSPAICRGVYSLNRKTKTIEPIMSKSTILATGGAGKVYVYTSNPDAATGDGMAIAYRAGAEMANMEFVQFHPTCLYHPHAKSFLLSEALRGEGGVLKLANNEEFMEKYDSRGSLATRDIVARAIDFELKKRGDDYVLLDMTSIDKDYLTKRFPNIHSRCLQFGLDMTKQSLPVVPAAHYFCGGVRTDMGGRTSVPGLYAIGEVACTGFHGANRLASNSLLEAVVFGRKAAENAITWVKEAYVPTDRIPQWDTGNATDSDESVVVTQNWDEIRHFMWNYVGIVRSNKRLDRAKRRIEMVQEEIREYYWNFLLTPDLVELRNIASVAELVIFSARQRTESRGLHYNIDYPNQYDNDKIQETIIRRGPQGKPILSDQKHPYNWE
jgi:L-aspartate oxidase